MSEQVGSEESQAPTPRFDESQIQMALDQIRGEQNLTMGSVAGAAAAVVGAALWAVVTVVTEYQIGFMAIGVGLLVGYAVKKFGKGVENVYGIVGAVLALLGCGLGNLLAMCGLIASYQEMPFMEVLSSLDLQSAGQLMVDTFSPMDLVFYGIAVVQGYKISIHEPTEEEIAARITGGPTPG